MSQLLFDQLEIHIPDINLGVGSGSQAIQTAVIMKRFKPIALEFDPDRKITRCAMIGGIIFKFDEKQF